LPLGRDIQQFDHAMRGLTYASDVQQVELLREAYVDNMCALGDMTNEETLLDPEGCGRKFNRDLRKFSMRQLNQSRQYHINQERTTSQ
jgi:hypothetical protein